MSGQRSRLSFFSAPPSGSIGGYARRGLTLGSANSRGERPSHQARTGIFRPGAAQSLRGHVGGIR